MLHHCQKCLQTKLTFSGIKVRESRNTLLSAGDRECQLKLAKSTARHRAEYFKSVSLCEWIERMLKSLALVYITTVTLNASLAVLWFLRSGEISWISKEDLITRPVKGAQLKLTTRFCGVYNLKLTVSACPWTGWYIQYSWLINFKLWIPLPPWKKYKYDSGMITTV